VDKAPSKATNNKKRAKKAVEDNEVEDITEEVVGKTTEVAKEKPSAKTTKKKASKAKV
jgi:hypothetical protein